MKGKIDGVGAFYILRGDQMKLQACPYSNRGVCCGDLCPLFREPVISESTTVVGICGGIYHKFDEFTDERGEE